jgi:hypothetical protein
VPKSALILQRLERLFLALGEAGRRQRTSLLSCYVWNSASLLSGAFQLSTLRIEPIPVYRWRNGMKTIASLLIALSLLAGVAAPASAEPWIELHDFSFGH